MLPHPVGTIKGFRSLYLSERYLRFLAPEFDKELVYLRSAVIIIGVVIRPRLWKRGWLKPSAPVVTIRFIHTSEFVETLITSSIAIRGIFSVERFKSNTNYIQHFAATFDEKTTVFRQYNLFLDIGQSMWLIE